MRPLLVIAFGLVLLSGAAEAAQVLHRPNDGEPDTLDAQKSTVPMPSPSTGICSSGS
jgi:hypothetical protein